MLRSASLDWMLLMFEIGDKAVCIKPFKASEAHPAISVTELPQVGMVYTIIDFAKQPGTGALGLVFEELDCLWKGRRIPSAWLASHFRKVVPFEEPKRKAVSRELEDA